MKKDKTFSVKARGRSIRYAVNGIVLFFKSEHNAIIHLLITAVVILLSLVLHVSAFETIALVMAIGFVWVAELFNTAIEKTLDFVSMEKSPPIKFIKDLSAAAVLVAVLIAVVVGCIVFIPRLW